MSRRFMYDKEQGKVVEVGTPPKPRKEASAWSKPLHCESLGVNPKHVKFQRELDAELGVGGTEYDTEGRPVFYSPGKYNEYMKAHGYHQRGKITNKQISHPVDGGLLARIIDRFRESP